MIKKSDLYELSVAEKNEVFKEEIANPHIAVGPWIKEGDSIPWRIVLRDIGREYAVHSQFILNRTSSVDVVYECGWYSGKLTKDVDKKLESAIRVFCRRVKELFQEESTGSDPGDDPDYVGA